LQRTVDVANVGEGGMVIKIATASVTRPKSFIEQGILAGEELLVKNFCSSHTRLPIVGKLFITE
jgi:hypothetical protein